MAMELITAQNARLDPIPDIKLAKASYELYAGQVLKVLVVSQIGNQVNLNINGSNLSAKTAHQFTAGQLLPVKVIKNEQEIILQVQQEVPSLDKLHSSLLQSLPQQRPANELLQLLSQLQTNPNLSDSLKLQIQQFLSSLTPLHQLPAKIMETIAQSGYFLEAGLAGNNKLNDLKNDFKGRCLQLLALLGANKNIGEKPGLTPYSSSIQQEPVMLPGAIPQPFHKLPDLSFNEQSIQQILGLLQEQTEQALARITAGQLNHLMNSAEHPYSLMLDLPVQLDNQATAFPIYIQEESKESARNPRWSFHFALNLDNLGPLQAKVTLQENAIDVQINAELQTTVDFLTEKQREFAAILEDLGLQLGQWHLKQGIEKNHIDTVNFKLLDIRV